MANILFYAPFNQRSRDTESLMLAFRKQGHNVICLSQQEGYLINDFLNANGVTAVSYVIPGPRSGWWYYCRHLFFFIRFCWKHDIDVVYSHLEPANFVASIGQFFIRGRTYLCRHHVDEGKLYKFDKDIYYNLTYFFARRIIVVSKRAKEYMIGHEGIPEKKILHINLAYDFNLYEKVDSTQVKQIREKYRADLLLLTACRLTKYKRPQLAIQLVKELRDRGHDVKLVMLGKGEMLEGLHQMIAELGLEGRIFLEGYVSNVLEYMNAADYFIHPSVLDSSCVSVKEAGLVELPSIVCKGIGDFEDYIVDGENGFLVDAEEFVERSVDVISRYSTQKLLLEKIGENLKKSVLELFSVDKVVARYSSLNRI
jgi:L-malate glycosyltransferase